MKRCCLALLSLFLFWMACAPRQAAAYAEGPDPAKTGAPGEQTCNNSGCHNSFKINSGPGSLSIDGLPATYTPGQTYDLMVTIAQAGQKRWGFQMSTRKDGGVKQRGGTLAITDKKLTQFVVNPKPPGLQYLEHTLSGTRNGTLDGPVQFPVQWTAPDAGTGPVTLYVAGNAANGNGENTGDYIYTTSANVPEGSNIAISVAPQSQDVTPVGTVDFTATVTGVDNPRVAWEIHPPQSSDGPGEPPTLSCATQTDLTCEGLKTTVHVGQGSVGTWVVEAISLDDLSKTATAQINIVPPPVTTMEVKVSPPSSSLTPGVPLQLTATVTNNANTAVNWSVQDTSGGAEVPGGNATLGTISPTGLYTAPSTVGAQLHLTIRARAQANTDVSGTADVTVTDIQPPTITQTSPQSGAFISGSVNLTADSTDDSSVASVSWFLDGSANPLGVDPGGHPGPTYSLKWDTTTVPDGPHTLNAKAADAAGNVKVSGPIAFTVDNTAPAFRKIGFDGSFLKGTVNLAPDVSDNLALDHVSYQLNADAPFAALTTAPYTFAWDTTKLADGAYDVNAEAVDKAGNVTPLKASVTIDNTPPVASITKPASGDGVSGSVKILGTAADAHFASYALDYGLGAAPTDWTPITGDQLQPVQDGILGTWNTLSLAPGAYSLRLQVKDQAGSATTEVHTITVARAGDVVPDGKVNVGDAILALQIAVGSVTGTADQLAAADLAPINTDGSVGDGRVTAADVVVILRLALGLPVGPAAAGVTQ